MGQMTAFPLFILVYVVIDFDLKSAWTATTNNIDWSQHGLFAGKGPDPSWEMTTYSQCPHKVKRERKRDKETEKDSKGTYNIITPMTSPTPITTQILKFKHYCIGDERFNTGIGAHNSNSIRVLQPHSLISKIISMYKP